jgi:hypothetical protein
VSIFNECNKCGEDVCVCGEKYAICDLDHLLRAEAAIKSAIRAKQAKIALDLFDVRVCYGGRQVNISIARELFEDAIDPRVVCGQVLAGAMKRLAE